MHALDLPRYLLRVVISDPLRGARAPPMTSEEGAAYPNL